MTAFTRFLAAFFTCCLTAVSVYCVAYDVIFSVIFFHLGLIGMGVIVLLAVGLLLLRINDKSRVLTLLYALSWAVFTGLIVLGYGLTFLGEAMLSIPLPFAIFRVYAGQFTRMIHAYGVSPWVVGGGLALLPVSITAFFVYFRTAWWRGTQHVRVNVNYAGQFLRKRTPAAFRVRLVGGVVIGALLGFTAYTLSYRPISHLRSYLSRQFQYVQEPLFMVFCATDMGGLSLAETVESPSIRAGYPKKLVFNRKPVILIIVDALRADHLPLYGYTKGYTPFLTELASTGRLHKVAYAFSASTASFPGILSLLRSKTWPRMAVNSFALHDLLKDQGYGINFILAGDHTNFFDIKSLYGKSVDRYFDGIHSDRYYINDDQVLVEGLATLKPGSSASAFYYFHLMSVHQMGLRHAAYLRHLPADATGSDSVRYQNHYNNGVTQADHYIRLLFDNLQQRGLLTNSLVVITADHGESLGEGGQYFHSHGVPNRETHIPLLIYDPDTSVTYRTDHAIQADVAATLVDRLGLPIPPTWEGESLLRPSRRPFSYHCMGSMYAIIQYQSRQILKYLYNSDTRQEQLFDLKADPTESHDLLLSAQPTTLAPFRQRMHPFVTETKGRTNPYTH